MVEQRAAHIRLDIDAEHVAPIGDYISLIRYVLIG
jgi:hypothetical protein